jgi:hypothetical protein
VLGVGPAMLKPTGGPLEGLSRNATLP